jgi:hypothetical protein
VLLSQPAPQAPVTPSPGYFELLERNTHIIYPVLLLLALTVIGLAMLQAYRSRQGVDPKLKTELKREIIFELRRQVAGASTDDLAEHLNIPRAYTAKLLSEMEEDGVLVAHASARHGNVWRVKGVGPGA